MKFLFPLLWALSASVGEVQLTLPPVVYAVPGVPVSIYHDNVVLTESPEKLRFEFSCAVGSNEARRWTVLATDQEVGDHPLSVTVKDGAGTVLEQGQTTVRISARDSGHGETVRILIVGDSLTHSTHYPNEIARLLACEGSSSGRDDIGPVSQESDREKAPPERDPGTGQ